MPKTGPRSDRGKADSGRNGWKHGILSEVMAIDGLEEPQEWETLRDGVVDSLEPENDLERLLAERIAIALWKLRRLETHLNFLTLSHMGSAEKDVQIAEAFAQRTLAKGVFPEVSEEAVLRVKLLRSFPPLDEMNLIMRYEAHLHRQYIQTIHELEAMQTRRKGGTSPLARLDIIGGPGD